MNNDRLPTSCFQNETPNLLLLIKFHWPKSNLAYIIKVSYIYYFIYCILRGWIKGFNHSVTTIMCEDGSYRTVVG